MREREKRKRESKREGRRERGRDSKILKKNNPKKSHVLMKDFFMLKFY